MSQPLGHIGRAADAILSTDMVFPADPTVVTPPNVPMQSSVSMSKQLENPQQQTPVDSAKTAATLSESMKNISEQVNKTGSTNKESTVGTTLRDAWAFVKKHPKKFIAAAVLTLGLIAAAIFSGGLSAAPSVILMKALLGAAAGVTGGGAAAIAIKMGEKSAQNSLMPKAPAYTPKITKEDVDKMTPGSVAIMYKMVTNKQQPIAGLSKDELARVTSRRSSEDLSKGSATVQTKDTEEVEEESFVIEEDTSFNVGDDVLFNMRADDGKVRMQKGTIMNSAEPLPDDKVLVNIGVDENGYINGVVVEKELLTKAKAIAQPEIGKEVPLGKFIPEPEVKPTKLKEAGKQANLAKGPVKSERPQQEPLDVSRLSAKERDGLFRTALAMEAREAGKAEARTAGGVRRKSEDITAGTQQLSSAQIKAKQEQLKENEDKLAMQTRLGRELSKSYVSRSKIDELYTQLSKVENFAKGSEVYVKWGQLGNQKIFKDGPQEFLEKGRILLLTNDDRVIVQLGSAQVVVTKNDLWELSQAAKEKVDAEHLKGLMEGTLSAVEDSFEDNDIPPPPEEPEEEELSGKQKLEREASSTFKSIEPDDDIPPPPPSDESEEEPPLPPPPKPGT